MSENNPPQRILIPVANPRKRFVPGLLARTPQAAAHPVEAPDQNKARQVSSLISLRGQISLEITGKISRVLFVDEKTKVGMLVITGPDGETLKVKGTLFFTPVVGETIRVSAVVSNHEKYGLFYEAKAIDEVYPVDPYKAVTFLAGVLTGVDRKLATEMFSAFGASIYEVMEKSPLDLLKVAGINETLVESISKSWKVKISFQALCKELRASKELTQSKIFGIYDAFGAESIEVVNKRPYDLIDVPEFTFGLVDQIAMSRGSDPNSLFRVVAAIKGALDEDLKHGNTMCSGSSVISHVSGLLSHSKSQMDSQTVSMVIKGLADRGVLVSRVINGIVYLSKPLHSIAEFDSATSIARLMSSVSSKESLIEKAGKAASQLNDIDQSLAVQNAFRYGVTILTGRPGCGKTTVTKTIAEFAEKQGLKVVMCAYTGAASQRTVEATGHASSTVHSLIGLKPGDDLSQVVHTAKNTLDGDLFIVDEATMLDNITASLFFNAIPAGARVVLVGDVDQIEAVSPGNVFADLAESGFVNVTRLNTVHRTANGSDIPTNASFIVDGEIEKLDLRNGKDFRCTLLDDEVLIRNEIVNEYLRQIENHGQDSVQILSARWATECGVNALNKAIRDAVNPISRGQSSVSVMGADLRVGDRVMRSSSSKELNVFNGEIGRIISINERSKTAVVRFRNRDVVHEGKELSQLGLAYAITMHKSQGSEYAAVIASVPRSHQAMLHRNLLYTAITRGKHDAIIVGSEAAIKRSVSTPRAHRRTGFPFEINRAFRGRSKIQVISATRQPASPPLISPTSVISISNEAREAVSKKIGFRRMRP